jgi:hypothetical protein
VLDLVAELPHPDPAQGSGCRLVLVDQHASLVVEGPWWSAKATPRPASTDALGSGTSTRDAHPGRKGPCR